MKFSAYFDKIFIIHLPERKDRHTELMQEISSWELDHDMESVEIFPGIKPTERKGFKKQGFRGSLLSHTAVLREAKKRSLKRVVVMEDDILITGRFLKEEHKIIDNLKNIDWDILYLGHFLPYNPQIKNLFYQYTEQSGPLGMHFYAIQSALYDPLINYLENVDSRPPGHPEGGAIGADASFNLFRKFHPEYKIYLANPSFGLQRSSASGISPGWFDSLPVPAGFLRFFRKIKNWTKK